MSPDTLSVRDSLNIKRDHFFVSYGMGSTARKIVDGMREIADVSSGVALDNVELEESKNIPTVVLRDPKDFGSEKLFDRVYCNYGEFPKGSRDVKRALTACNALCVDKGMVLVTNLNERENVFAWLMENHVTKYWILNESAKKFNVLYTKESHGRA